MMTHPYRGTGPQGQGHSGSDQLQKTTAAAKAQEMMLVGARKQRKETDDQLQAMMNRIAYLAQEELRLDRDIEAARRRAAEALARQSTKDHEIAATAKEVLAAMPPAMPAKLRPHTGRSKLLASLSEGSAGAAAGAAASLRSSLSSHSSLRAMDSTATTAAAAAAAADRAAAGPAASTSGREGVAGPMGIPPRAPSASRGRPPVPIGRAADKVNRLPPVPAGGGSTLRSPSPGNRPGTASRKASPASASPPASAAGTARRPSSSGSSGSRGTAAAAAAAAAPLPAHPHPQPSIASSDPDLVLGGGASSAACGMQQLSGRSAAGRGEEWEGGDLAGGGAWAAGSSRNAMAVIRGGGGGDDGSHGAELDGEVLEELQQGGAAAAGRSSGGPSGLQEFATESGRRVVQVKASRKGEGGATVSAGGVGWGMGGRAGGGAAILPREAKQLQAELAKKQSIWKVRKTFGLEPTPMSDRTAQVEEAGAGAWQ